ncbi:serine hydrolase [Streptomyces sp. NPDC005897]|uniref:serine hydrolase domain-containing protein n=1 Tax=Streptomyces sp. NPDC005897 TaxID=3157081 RepID=UPI0033E9C6BD
MCQSIVRSIAHALGPAAQTDAFLVMHRGSVVHETYLHDTEQHTPHFNASAAKSYLGLMAAILAHQGLLDRAARASTYVPELAGTAFGEATVEDLLHMGTQVSYAGRPFDKAIEAQRYYAVIAPPLRPFGYNGPTSIREHLLTARVTGAAPGTEFRYENGNVETLAEVLRRITGLTTSALLGELVWSKIGADEDAYCILDGDGVEAAYGGFSAKARDIARLGEMMRCGARSAAGRSCPRRWPPPSSAASPTATLAAYASPPRPPTRRPRSRTTTCGGS